MKRRNVLNGTCNPNLLAGSGAPTLDSTGTENVRYATVGDYGRRDEESA
ncbi:hypothetical protein [Haladaptatus sp. T7]|nr:hypothetical protein [Haladaptatus sp. T7]